ncbi:hypothetical protein PFISCL1PPCAC_394 [Pristionchus fissidentatus]|uniref:Ubiquitin carboxyl-terminal hydrolase 39 n=1 Tax=Pristionchus fissidentatus TaxID=1538716 RepID=A0AAV5UPS0_9BILA|nr:hypothetical protein PFISCL1PPCAC_394 [Pristionchus fissidentatus]
MTSDSREASAPVEERSAEEEHGKSRKREREETRENKSPSPPAKHSRKEEKEKDRKKEDKDRKSSRKDKKDDKEREKDKKRSEKDKDRKDKDRKRRSRSRSTDRKDKKRDRKEKDENGDVEEGEVKEEAPPPPEPRPLTEREKARLKLIEEMQAKEESVTTVAPMDDPVWCAKKAQEEKPSRHCPYLDTIDRTVLDFDFEKLCSISLSHLNVYACMVCGKYFQGRGTNTHAYTHSLDTDHRVFLNLQTLKFFCLPDNYEVTDPSLDDIKYVLKPHFSDQLIKSLNGWTRSVRALDDSTYYPGVVGLNNIKANDYENVILHAFSHVPPLRDYFLKEDNYAAIKRPPGDKLQELTRRFGELIRKLWNTKAFKAHVSPHEMLQAIVLCSEKKFQFTKQGDAAEFMNFLLNTMHSALNGTAKTNSSIVYKTFRGRMRVFTRKVPPVDASEDQRRMLMQLPEYQEETKEQPFLFLSLDLPPTPLYRDELMQNIIPQVPLHVLLQKFNGQTEKEYKTYNENFMKRFELLSLPLYLIISYKRFHKNQWFVEKNPTIVNFPISNVDLYECVAADKQATIKYTTYDLLANIIHDGPPEQGRYRTQLHHTGSTKWFELEDLHVKDILPQMITLAESYIQIWKLNTEKTREQRMEEVAPEGDLSTITN